MASYRDKIAWWGDRICGKGRIDVTFMGRSPVRIQPEMKNAVIALEAAFIDNGYQLPIGVTGSYSCRKIGGTTKWSLHAIPIAIDVDYGNNKHLRERIPRGYGTDPRFKITETQVDAVEAIKNSDGVSIWKWLGWALGDTMHFEIDVRPEDCEPVNTKGNKNMKTWPRFGDNSWDVEYVQVRCAEIRSGVRYVEGRTDEFLAIHEPSLTRSVYDDAFAVIVSDVTDSPHAVQGIGPREQLQIDLAWSDRFVSS